MILIFATCKDSETIEPVDPVPDPKTNMAEMPYDNLSDYNIFEGDMTNLSPTEGVIPYELNTPLFSDYALKSRFIWMPKGQAATYDNEDIFDFPVGTIIVKTFYYYNDFLDTSQGKNIIETRLLIHRDTGWMAAPYLWNETQTDAEYHIVGKQIPVSWKHTDGLEKTINYVMPNKVECTACHNIDNNLFPIGPKARNMNRTFSFAEGEMNQLEKLVEVGYLDAMPDLGQVPAVPLWEVANSGTTEERARAYLDVNCGHCHNPRGPAKNSALNLYYFEEDSLSLGICKPPIAAGQGSGGFAYDIVPGQPDSSIIIYRMNSTELDIAMPEISRSTIHDEGVQLIRDWILGMEGDCN